MIKWVNKKRNTKGFTLMELIIVIAILGILAAIALPKFSGFTEKAKEAADKATAATISNAVKLYVASENVNYDIDAGKGTLATLGDLLEVDVDAPQFVSRLYKPAANGAIYWKYDSGKVIVTNGDIEVPTK